MQLALDCIPCFINQVIRLSERIGFDEDTTRNLMNTAWDVMKNSPPEITPPEVALQVYQTVFSYTDIEDPLIDLKSECTDMALALYPGLKELVRHADDPLRMALQLAVAGNVIDFGQASTFDIQAEIDKVLAAEFPIFDYDSFVRAQDKTDMVLYIADNAGESVFDRILIEEMKKPVVYAVRSEPVQNDVVYEDALQAGIDKVATVLSSGAPTPGAVVKLCSPEFLDLYDSAGMVISKGQGNYEALSDETRPIFFLLKVKCRHFSHVVGVPEGSYVVQLRNG